jgi:hypothetical protein
LADLNLVVANKKAQSLEEGGDQGRPWKITNDQSIIEKQ